MHKDGNDQLINKIWLSDNLIPRKNIHFIRLEFGPVKIQRKYEKILKKDLMWCFLSMGEGSYIASFLPYHDNSEGRDMALECNSLKPHLKELVCHLIN